MVKIINHKTKGTSKIMTPDCEFLKEHACNRFINENTSTHITVDALCI